MNVTAFNLRSPIVHKILLRRDIRHFLALLVIASKSRGAFIEGMEVKRVKATNSLHISHRLSIWRHTIELFNSFFASIVGSECEYDISSEKRQ